MAFEHLDHPELFDFVGLSAAELALRESDEVVRAAVAIAAFVKIVKAVRYYPKEYPLINKLQRECLALFQTYLNEFHALAIGVTETTFTVAEKVIFTAHDLKTSVPFLLYRDGIREMRFLEGITEEELLAFMTLLIQVDTQADADADDDLVTLFAERDFIHLDLLTVDTFLDEITVIVPETVEEFRAGLTSHPVLHFDTDAAVARAEGDTAVAGALTAMLESNRDIYCLTPEEIDRLQREVAIAVGGQRVLQCVPTLCELLARESDPELVRVLLDGLLLSSDALLKHGLLVRVADILRELHHQAHAAGAPGWRRDLLGKALESFGHAPRLEQLTDGILAQPALPAETARTLLSLLPAGTTPVLLRLFARLPAGELRGIVADALVAHGQRSTQAFHAMLEDPRAGHLRDLLPVLARLDPDVAVPLLIRVLQHQDPTVRTEVVQLATGLRSEHVETLLLKAMADRHETVRNQAARALGRRRTPRAATLLLERVQERAFERKTASEQRAVLEGLLLSGHAQALPVVRNLLLRRSFFHQRKVDAQRQSAALALAAVGTAETLALLRELENHRDSAIRTVCQHALQVYSR